MYVALNANTVILLMEHLEDDVLFTYFRCLHSGIDDWAILQWH